VKAAAMAAMAAMVDFAGRAAMRKYLFDRQR
jgi:hypothetical protein